MPGKSLKRPVPLLIIILLISAAFVLSLNLNKPFVGHHDFMSAMEGNIAKNYLKFGFWDLKFGQITGNVVSPAGVSYFTHYPPLLPILIAISFSVIGIAEWAERLVPTSFSLMGVVFFFLITEKLWNKRTAILAGLFFIFNPMFVYFGSLPAPEPLILAMALAAVYFYLSWLDQKNHQSLIFLCLALFIGGLIGWPIGYLGPLIILHSLMVKKFQWTLVLPSLVIVLTVLFQIAHGIILNGISVFLTDLRSTVSFRLTENNLSFGGQDFSYLNYFRQEASWLQAYFTRILIILSAVYVFFNLNLKFNLQKATILLFLLLGLAHPIIFSRYVFIHDFLNIYLLPFFALAGALGLEKIIEITQPFIKWKHFALLVMVVIVVVFGWERKDYTQALLVTNMNMPGLEMAQTLNKLQSNPNEAVILSPRFASFYGIFTEFYSEYPFKVLSEEQLKRQDTAKRFKYIITFDEDISDRVYYQQLIKRYNFEKIKDITVIKTAERVN